MGVDDEAGQGNRVSVMARGGSKPAVGLTLKVEGVAALEGRLRKTGLRLSDLDFTNIANEGLRLAAQYAPKRSGTLAGSLKGRAFKSKAVIRAGSKKVPYAAPINYGWRSRNIEPALFLQKADEQLKRSAPKDLQRQVATLIRRQGFVW
jgi:hypothetical protein